MRPIERPTSRTVDSKDRLDFLWKTHGYTNDYIRFADSKAGFIAVSVAGLVGALFATHVFDALCQTPLDRWPVRCWLAMLALVLLVISFILAIVAIRPRLRSTVRKGFIYWESILAHGSELEFAAQSHKLDSDAMEQNVSRHLYVLALICTRKYFWANLSMWMGGVGGVIACVVVLISHVCP